MLGDLKQNNIKYYWGSIYIAGNIIDEVKKKMKTFFDNLKSFNLTLDPKKLQLIRNKINVLGFRVSASEISLDLA